MTYPKYGYKVFTINKVTETDQSISLINPGNKLSMDATQNLEKKLLFDRYILNK